MILGSTLASPQAHVASAVSDNWKEGLYSNTNWVQPYYQELCYIKRLKPKINVKVKVFN